MRIEITFKIFENSISVPSEIKHCVITACPRTVFSRIINILLLIISQLRMSGFSHILLFRKDNLSPKRKLKEKADVLKQELSIKKFEIIFELVLLDLTLYYKLFYAYNTSLLCHLM